MEFDLIQKYFMRHAKNTQVILGNGDDCALLQSDRILALSMDTMVEGTHFIKDKISPADLGYRVLAVNLSDCAAMGAKPIAFLLALTLREVDEPWLAEFSRGLFTLADQFHLDLLGGNIAKGPLNITIQIIGELPKNKGLKRSDAKIEDDIYVTGTLGLQITKPTPRVVFAQGLLDLAHAAIDISDGLAQDLSHILKASHCGALVDIKAVPGQNFDVGEDYELCFTAPPKNHAAIQTWATQTNTPLTIIGKIIAQSGLRDIHTHQPIPIKGYQHFS